MDRAWTRLSVHDGRIDWWAGEPKIIQDKTTAFDGLGIIKVEFWDIVGTDEDTGLLVGKHKVLWTGSPSDEQPGWTEAPTWVDGPLPGALIWPHPDHATEIERYLGLGNVAAAYVSHVYALGQAAPTLQNYWIALTTFPPPMTEAQTDVLIDDGEDGPTMGITGAEGSESISLTLRKQSLTVEEYDVSLGTPQSMAALLVSIGDLMATGAASAAIDALIGAAIGELEIPTNHPDLADMPDLTGTNPDHDERYFIHRGAGGGAGNPTDQSFYTTGNGELETTTGGQTFTGMIDGGGVSFSGGGGDANIGIEITTNGATTGRGRVEIDGDEVLSARKEIDAYTADEQDTAYEAQSTEDIAKLSDLNALRVAYENLRGLVEDLLENVILPTNGHGLAEEKP